MKEGMSKVVTSSVIAGGSETVSGIAMRGAGTFVTSGFDVEAAAGDAFDFKYIATDFVIGAGSAGIKEYTSLVSAQKAADVEISSYNRNNDVMLKAENSGLTNLVESKNGGIDFSQSDYIFKTDTGDVMEIKIEATGSISKDYQAAEKIAMEKYGIDLSQMRKGTDSTYKWHWLDDYNVMNNEVTMQFVNKEALNKLENIDIPKGNATKQYYVIHGNISSYGRGTSNNVYEGWKYSNAAKDMATSIRDNSISALNNNDKITSSEYMQLAY